VEAITKTKDGHLVFNLDASLGNADWLRTSRLSKEEQEKRFNTPMYRVIYEGEDGYDDVEDEIYDDGD
jgi:hypothetical protein